MDDIVEFYKGKQHVGNMPVDTFNGLIDSWIENNQENTEYHDAIVTDVLVDGKPFILLHYNHEWDIYMQGVTWYYVARSNYGRSKPFWRTRVMRMLFGNRI